MYGCNAPSEPEETRLFPFLMSKVCPFFSYRDSRFGNQKSKESTARIALFNELKCRAIYTIESSFCGNDTGPFKNYHFSTGNLMQTGRDFCRALILHLPIPVPQSITQHFMKNIQDQYNHYKMLLDTGYNGDAEETRAMALYFERLDKVKQQGKEVQSKHIKKGLLAVLRQTADIFSDGNTTSSVGSEPVPSEDNLDIEQAQEVLPVQEDPELVIKLKQNEERKLEEQKQSSDVQPRRRHTVVELGLQAKKKLKGFAKEGQHAEQKEHRARKKDRRGTVAVQNLKIDEQDEFAADDEAVVKETNHSEKDKAEQNDNVVELADQGSAENVVHRKRRRRNVESRDAWT